MHKLSYEKEGSGRRPSRRAAQIAAEKIHNNALGYGLATEGPVIDVEIYPLTPPKPKPKPTVRNSPVSTTTKPAVRSSPVSTSRRSRAQWHAIRAPLPDIDLLMECHEELLTPVQAQAFKNAQREYNAVMNRLRHLKASNGWISYSIKDDSDLSKFPDLPVVSSVSTVPAASPNAINITTLDKASSRPVLSDVVSVIPMHLVAVPTHLSNNGTHVLNPGSPALIVADKGS